MAALVFSWPHSVNSGSFHTRTTLDSAPVIWPSFLRTEEMQREEVWRSWSSLEAGGGSCGGGGEKRRRRGEEGCEFWGVAEREVELTRGGVVGKLEKEASFVEMLRKKKLFWGALIAKDGLGGELEESNVAI
ncbi:hypothetical protein U1Q18_044106 [Sarracenia purpurea var. burkii]